MRNHLKHKKRIIIKIGSSSLTHKESGHINFQKIEHLVRALCDLKNQGKDVILVSSGAIAVGRKQMGLYEKPKSLPEKQALAAIGQAKLMMIYEKIFSEYSQTCAQVLMTKYTVLNETNRFNAKNTLEQLLNMGVIPIVNENDTVSTDEIEFGDNDHLSAVVTALVEGDLLILLSDIDGMYTDDPNKNPNATLIPVIESIDEKYIHMAKNTSKSNLGTGGMAAKVDAAKIAVESGADMIIASGEHIENIVNIINGNELGTLFVSSKNSDFDWVDYIS